MTYEQLMAEARTLADLARQHLWMCDCIASGPVRESCHQLARDYVARARAMVDAAARMRVVLAIAA